MTKTQITTAEAATTAHVTTSTIRTWCRLGIITATKQAGKWAIRISSLYRLTAAPTDRPRKTTHAPARKPARFDSIARQQHNLRQVADRVNTGQHTAADYLTTVLGADPDFTRRYSSPFGKAAAKAYREQYGQDPAKTGLDVRGHRLVTVYAYTVETLQKATVAYPRTAPLALAA
jgi:hypothetical protein